MMTVKNIERGVTDARGSTLGKIETAFNKAGVAFIAEDNGGPGVRLKAKHQKGNDK